MFGSLVVLNARQNTLLIYHKLEDIVKIRGITSTEWGKMGVDDDQNLMFQ